MDLYQELILDHSKRPRHAGLREPYEAEVHHINPTCGDEVTLRVHVDGSGDAATLADVSYDHLGCSISTASTSILAEECTGRPLAEVFETYRGMRSMITSKGADPGDEDVIGDGVALAGVAQYPARVKCALLGWSALLDALAQTGVDISSTSSETTPAADPSAAPETQEAR